MTNIKERNKKVKAKTIIIIVIMCLFAFAITFFSLGTPENAIEIATLVIVCCLEGMIIYCGYKILLVVFEDQEYRKESIRIAENLLSSKEQTEIVPIIKPELTYGKIISELTHIAKFYAIINEENKIQISIKYNHEDKLRKITTVDKEFFTMSYKVLS